MAGVIRKVQPQWLRRLDRQLNFGVIDYSVAVSGSNVYGVSYISDVTARAMISTSASSFSTGGVRAQAGACHSSADSNSVSALSTDRDGNIYSGSIEPWTEREMPTA